MEEFVERGAMLGRVYAGAMGDRLTKGMPRGKCSESKCTPVDVEVEVKANRGKAGVVFQYRCWRGTESTCDDLGC